MLGRIELEQFNECKMPQEYASAWSAVSNLMGASYRPLICLGRQIVSGVDYFFIAEQTTVTRTPIRHVVAITIHGFEDNYVVENIEEII